MFPSGPSMFIIVYNSIPSMFIIFACFQVVKSFVKNGVKASVAGSCTIRYFSRILSKGFFHRTPPCIFAPVVSAILTLPHIRDAGIFSQLIVFCCFFQSRERETGVLFHFKVTLVLFSKDQVEI